MYKFSASITYYRESESMISPSWTERIEANSMLELAQKLMLATVSIQEKITELEIRERTLNRKVVNDDIPF